ncbi:hypothetical protein DFH08DRAFT_453536 [Mycena albidolilacea]|uniref:Nephrocystin 3-like N-terminal domain-containing protein n=1 Tax=Mycena albidolilacea TaxID=1033008 RepID=A0AAD6Z8F8_9AGAR|nr:hypothetical protein DFH08DRAFT_453536 [Mycena albidolilacea]
MEMIGSTITFTALPYTSNAGWDDTQTCLAGTRQAEIAKVMAWVRKKDISGTEQIYFLADVVGSGKTALAHSIAWECSDCNLLASSFFFDRKVGRTNPRNFIFNLARDLGSRFPEVSIYISLALRADPNLALSQPVSQLFKELVLEPIRQSNIAGPIVLVVDALHEVETPEVQTILCTQIPSLSGQLRVFVTSRPERSVLRSLGPAITPHDLAIHESANRADMKIYVAHRLEQIALEHELEKWPNQQLVTTLLDRAEGLFIWIATICDYLFHHVYPDKILQDLLETMRESQLPPEKKMDTLYSSIMALCQWDDVYFVEGYQQVMGVMVVENTPLTVDGLQRLHGTMPRVKAIVIQLASLITGLTSRGVNRPIQILHSSFREYVTQRAPGSHRIFVEEQNVRVAHICLRLLNDTLSLEAIGCGYLNSKKGSGVPNIEIEFTEEQWYAVEFWITHITNCNFMNSTTGVQVEEALSTFLTVYLPTWIEVIVSKSKYQSLIPLRRKLPDSLSLQTSKTRLGLPLRQLLKRLMEDESRLGEVLIVIEDLKDMGEDNWDTDSDSDGKSSLELESVSDSSDD